MTDAKETVWYRAWGRVTLKYDYLSGLLAKSSVEIQYDEFPVLSTTEQGVWLCVKHHHIPWSDCTAEKRFVLRNARKKFAAPTKEEALESLRCRNLKSVTRFAVQLDKANAIKAMLNKGE